MSELYVDCLALKMKELRAFETSVAVYQSTRCDIPSDLELGRNTAGAVDTFRLSNRRTVKTVALPTVALPHSSCSMDRYCHTAFGAYPRFACMESMRSRLPRNSHINVPSQSVETWAWSKILWKRNSRIT